MGTWTANASLRPRLPKGCRGCHVSGNWRGGKTPSGLPLALACGAQSAATRQRGGSGAAPALRGSCLVWVQQGLGEISLYGSWTVKVKCCRAGTWEAPGAGAGLTAGFRCAARLEQGAWLPSGTGARSGAEAAQRGRPLCAPRGNSGPWGGPRGPGFPVRPEPSSAGRGAGGAGERAQRRGWARSRRGGAVTCRGPVISRLGRGSRDFPERRCLPAPEPLTPALCPQPGARSRADMDEHFQPVSAARIWLPRGREARPGPGRAGSGAGADGSGRSGTLSSPGGLMGDLQAALGWVVGEGSLPSGWAEGLSWCLSGGSVSSSPLPSLLPREKFASPSALPGGQWGSVPDCSPGVGDGGLNIPT